MIKVYKYGLNYHSVPEIVYLPVGAEVTGLGYQEKNDPRTVMWAVVDDRNNLEKRMFFIALTGQEIPGKVVYAYNTIEVNKCVMTLLEVTDTEGFDPKEDDRLTLTPLKEIV